MPGSRGPRAQLRIAGRVFEIRCADAEKEDAKQRLLALRLEVGDDVVLAEARVRELQREFTAEVRGQKFTEMNADPAHQRQSQVGMLAARGAVPAPPRPLPEQHFPRKRRRRGLSGAQRAEILGQLAPRNGVSVEDLRALVLWLGQQARHLLETVVFIELFAGVKHRLSSEIPRRGHGVIFLGKAHGQNLATTRGVRLVLALVRFCTPRDVWIAWVCGPNASCNQYNVKRGGLTRRRILRGRRSVRRMIQLFHNVWQLQLGGGRHCHGENPVRSLAWKHPSFQSPLSCGARTEYVFVQCRFGLCVPWPAEGAPKLHQKRTVVHSSRNDMADHLCLHDGGTFLPDSGTELVWRPSYEGYWMPDCERYFVDDWPDEVSGDYEEL